MSLFSVIIPAYNRASLLRQSVESVLAQEFRDFELVIVDDGSTDATKQVLHSFGDKIRVFRQENLGPGAARNLGVQNSTGDYIAFLDSDDCWFPWTLATYARLIEENDLPSLICGALRYFSNEREIATIGPQSVASDYFPDYFTAARRGLYCGSGQMVVRRTVFLDVDGFALGKFNAEDHDLVMKLGTAPGFVNVIAPTVIACRQHADAVTRNLSRTFLGMLNLIQMEQMGQYPGGNTRRRERLGILAQHVRPLSLELLRHNEYEKAWTLYRQTFVWNLALGRLRYLAAFFLKAAL